MGQISLPEGLTNTAITENAALQNPLDADNSENGDEIREKLETIHMLYAAAKVKILSLADKLAAAETDHSSATELSETSASAVRVPLAESWELHLGDWVRIKYSMVDFKSIQKRTLGWTPRLKSIHACESVVTKQWSPFDNAVTVYTPSTPSKSSIYAGLLEKIPENERQKDDSFKSQWKVNDYVELQLRNVDKVIELFQRGLDDIPERYIGRRGRVIAVTRVAIVVTFNERTSYEVKSALLTKCADQSPLDIPVRTHENGFAVGQKVKVHSDVKKHIDDQKEYGGWEIEMTNFVGKEVKIVHVRKDGGLFVCYETGRHWLMNPKALCPLGASESSSRLFGPGDVVKIKAIDNARVLMRMIQIPTDLLEYLRLTAEVKQIDDDLDYMITYNGDLNVNIRAPHIRMATKEEKSKHETVKLQVQNMKIGTAVYFDVGPPNFVKAVLRDSGIDPEIVKALTNPSTLRGYDGKGNAVIEYENGKRYSVKKKHLTVPSKFNIQSHRAEATSSQM